MSLKKYCCSVLLLQINKPSKNTDEGDEVEEPDDSLTSAGGEVPGPSGSRSDDAGSAADAGGASSKKRRKGQPDDLVCMLRQFMESDKVHEQAVQKAVS